MPFSGLEIISRIQQIVADIFAMARTNLGGIVVFNFYRCPSSPRATLNSFIASSSRMIFIGVPCTYKGLRYVFSSSRPQAVVVNLFDDFEAVNPTIHASITDHLAPNLTPVPQQDAWGYHIQAGSTVSSIVDLPTVEVSFDRVMYAHRGTVISRITFNALVHSLLCLIESQLTQEVS